MASNHSQEEQFYDNIRYSGEESDQERAVPDVITKYGKKNSSNERDLGSGGFTKTRYKLERKVNIVVLLGSFLDFINCSLKDWTWKLYYLNLFFRVYVGKML